jgi:hypothetical protein
MLTEQQLLHTLKAQTHWHAWSSSDSQLRLDVQAGSPNYI